MVGLQKNVLLQLGRFDLIVIQNHILAQALHSIYLVVGLLLHKENLSKAATTNNLPDFEISESRVSVSVFCEGSSVVT